MIVDCPYCLTSNSGTGADTASGETQTGMLGMIVCRGCGRRFHAPQQANEVGANTTIVASPMAIDGDSGAGQPTEVALRLPDEVPDADPDSPTNVFTEATRHASSREGFAASTGIMGEAQLDENLRSMRERASAADAERDAGPQRHRAAGGHGGHGVLEDAWQRLQGFGRAAQERFLRLSMPARWGSAAAAFVLLVLVLVLARGGHRGASLAYATRDVALLAEPGHDPHGTAARAAPILLRGAQMTLFDTVGTLVMVRDLQGRVGYVNQDATSNTRPSSQPDTPFVDCQRGPQEDDAHTCESRAEEQWDACGSYCDHGATVAHCTDDCRSQYKHCLASCQGEAVRPEPAPTRPEAAPPPARAEPPPSAPAVRAETRSSPSKPKGHPASRHDGKKHRH